MQSTCMQKEDYLASKMVKGCSSGMITYLGQVLYLGELVVRIQQIVAIFIVYFQVRHLCAEFTLRELRNVRVVPREASVNVGGAREEYGSDQQIHSRPSTHLCILLEDIGKSAWDDAPVFVPFASTSHREGFPRTGLT
jgi:hypothetical protein